jgi:hypothetical protein
MNDILRDLLLNGFMIYPNNGKFVVKKEAVPSNPAILKESEYDSYDLAVEAAVNMLQTPQSVEWVAIVRYNRGLGIEYRNLPDVRATSKDEAHAMASRLADKVLGGGNVVISEVRVRLKN